MKVLVIGSGGREAALVWKIAQSPRVDKIYCAPGNGGIVCAELVDIAADDLDGLLRFAKGRSIDLTVVGPEAPLVAGIVDLFEANGLRVFGPKKELAALEGSKVFAKELMKSCGVPTADFKVFDSASLAREYLDKREAGPVVVKADGLCAGKGVVVCGTAQEATKTVSAMLQEKIFGEAGSRVIIEECLKGEEASIIVVVDGKDFVPMASSQDHKRVYDGDRGPNTGGMGAYSPAPVVTDELYKKIESEILKPLLAGIASKGKSYKGALYVGVMVTDSGPKVLEFNVRFGDPETQAILPRLKTDLVEVMERSLNGALKGFRLEWDERPCVAVVAASGGYPGNYEKGKEISGLSEVKSLKDVVVFHAGTKKGQRRADGDGLYVTAGGRVLAVSALGEDIKNAIENCYAAMGKIKFEGMHYRKDIGFRALEKIKA
jgi:phosphoribosylamine--glycine ligase